MTGALVGAGAAVGAGVVAWIWRGYRAQQVATERLRAQPGVPDEAQDEEAASTLPRNRLARARWVSWVTGGLAFCLIAIFAELALAYIAALAVMASVAAHLVEEQWASRRALRIETQLAEAIDLMVASLSAGAGAMEAIESASQEVASPLKEELAEVVGRIRLGDEQKVALSALADRVPLENFRLFTFTLAVHGESGGSLAPTLSTVGESIRDRIQMARSARSQSAQAQASVAGILGITWFLGLMMWRTAPDKFEEFLAAPFGASLTAGAMMMQAFGMVWISRLSRIRF